MSATVIPLQHSAPPSARRQVRVTGPAGVAQAFDECSDLVLRTAWRITGRPEDAEDVLQAVFLQLMKLPASSWPDSTRAYLHRAAVNGALDVLRRRKRRAEQPVDDDEAGPSADHESAMVERLTNRRLADGLREAVAALSPLEAEVFALCCLEEVDNVEAARILGKTPNHVGVTLHAARAKLKKALAPKNTRAGSTESGRARGGLA